MENRLNRSLFFGGVQVHASTNGGGEMSQILGLFRELLFG